jgi:hypothetical protein
MLAVELSDVQQEMLLDAIQVWLRFADSMYDAEDHAQYVTAAHKLIDLIAGPNATHYGV